MGIYTSAIQQLYVSYFARPADAGGLQFWEDQAARDPAALTQLANAFAHSNEYQSAMQGKSMQELVDQVYQNLFGRHAEADGLKYWGELLDNKTLSISNVVTQIANGAKGGDADVFAAKVLAATDFTQLLAQQTADVYQSTLAKELLQNIVSQKDVQNLLDGGLDKIIKQMMAQAGVAVGEPNPNGVAVGEPNPNGIAVGEPNPNAGQGIAVGEPHPQGIAVGEPNPGAHAGFAVGEPHPGMGFAVGEPHPAAGLIGQSDSSLLMVG